jgi:murein DD-endopeptidase MepM/ murein hydrolase activator NlpD
LNSNRQVALGILGAGVLGAAVAVLSAHYVPLGSAPGREIAPEASEPEPITEALAIRAGDTLADLLGRAGLDQASRMEAIDAVAGTFDVKKFRAGSQLTLSRSGAGTLESISYLIDPDHELQLSRPDGSFSAAIVAVPGVTRVVPVRGKLEGSLFESMEQAGERAELALRIAEIFGWSLDFYTDPREGDEFSVLIEKREYTNGQPPTYQRILAATYNNAGTLYDAYLFPDMNGKPLYYSRDGHSLQSAFLRSPFKFEARVSSHFSVRRRHPILKIVRPHLGTDYAAPAGTPVQTIGAGVVASAGWSGDSGNMVRIRHANGYETLYSHLSRILVNRGQRVEQGQPVGLVGATGLATGPHLDFRITRHGRYVNFERLRLPPAAEISPQQRTAFATARDRFAALMKPGPALNADVLASTGRSGDSRAAP